MANAFPAMDDHVIRLDGVFDAPAAARVQRALERTEPNVRLRLDLTHIREFHDLALAVLAQALTSNPARVALRGLRQHQVRMLRYFGVDAAPLEEVAAGDGR